MKPTSRTWLKSFTLLLTSCLLFQLAGREPRPAGEPVPRQTAGARRGPRVPAGTKVLRDVEYVPGGHERQKLDLHVPPAEDKVPLIIWVHGGAWLGGSKERPRALPFVREGYAVASINYRLSQHAVFPAQIEDCKAAVRWLRAHAAEHGIDPDRFGVWGASAGGHLVALLGTTGGVKEFEKGQHLDVSSRVQAVCDWFGPTDFTQMSRFPSRMDHDAADSPESRLVGGAIQENKDKVARANPTTYVSRDDPPFLIMHGDKDPLVPLNQSELLESALEKAGVSVRLHVVKGGGHGFGGPEITEMVRAFFSEHLKGAKPEKDAAEAEGSETRESIYKKTPRES